MSPANIWDIDINNERSEKSERENRPSYRHTDKHAQYHAHTLTQASTQKSKTYMKTTSEKRF